MIALPALSARALSRIAPGTLASAAIVAAAGLAASFTGISVMLFALLIGMAMNFLGTRPAFGAGIAFTSKTVLRLGVALLGLKITLGDVASLGWAPVLLVIAAVTLTIFASIGAARMMGFDPRFGLLSGGATAICGASAALALSASLPNHPMKERATLFTVIGVSTLSTVAMLLYPLVARAFGLDDSHAGIFIGAAIHDVAQVVGAGFAISPEAGNTATIVKLARVGLLVPVIVVAGLATRSADVPAHERPPLVPWFAAAFAILVVINSFLPLPSAITGAGNAASRFFLVAAIAALGMKTRIKDLAAFGWRPVGLMILQTMFIAGVALAAITAGWV